MTADRFVERACALRDHWLAQQDSILRDCLAQIGGGPALLPEVTGLRLGVGLGAVAGPDMWTCLPLIGRDGPAPVVADAQGRDDVGDVDADLYLPDGTCCGIAGQTAAHTALRRLASLGIAVMRGLADLSVAGIKASTMHPARRDLLTQDLLAMMCQAEMVAIAAADAQADTASLLAALADLADWHVTWAMRAELTAPDCIGLAKAVSAHVGMPWLLQTGAAAAAGRA